MKLIIYKNAFGNIAKYSLYILSIISLITASVQAQWQTQSPSPTFLDVRGVGAPSANRVFIATDDNSFDNSGSLFESNDGGLNWIQREIPISLSNPFNGLYFFDNLNGWVYGNDNYRTTDGGTNWTQMPFLGSTYFMKFYSQTFGLATGNFGMYISRDGGENWVESPNGMYAFDFIDSQTGLGIADSAIYRTTDAGNTFTIVYSGDVDAVVYLSVSTVVGIANGTFIRSTDGGITWSNSESSQERDQLLAVSENVVLAWGRTGIFPNYDDRILRSSDAGQTWTDLGEVIPDGIFAITSIGNQSIIVSDMMGNMFMSSDSGLNWQQTFNSPGPQPGYLSSAVPHFPDDQTGYFGYGAGFIIKTTDGGTTWTQISSGTGKSLYDVDRFPNNDLIAVGADGTVLKSNGNTPWIIQNTPAILDLVAVQALNEIEVIAIDENGKLFKSSDAGVNWSSSNNVPVNFDAKDLKFSSLSDGWIIGGGATGNVLHHTTDGGNSWNSIPGFGGAYVAVDFEGENGWALNVGGIYYRTSDNGVNWVQAELPGFPFQVQDMEFYDVSTGYAVGSAGYAARSDDGGLSWEILPTPNSTDNFTDIYLTGANEIWISTSNNKAYYSATGGQSWAVLETGSNGFGYFSAIVADSSGNAWTVGEQGYILHFIGPPPPPLNRPPDAAFDFDVTGLNVTLTDMSNDPDGVITSWQWDFGDSTGSTLQNPTHSYDTAGTYIVRLTVTDDDGATGSTVRFIVVQPGPGGTFGDFTEVTPLDSLFVTPQDEDFWVITTAPADYDNDGDLDIAVLGYYVVYNQSVEDKLVLIRNDGAAGSQEWEFSYIDVPLNDLSAGTSDLAWGDVDGDGDQDLAVGSYGRTVLYRNDDGTLILTDTELPGYFEDNDQADFDLRSLTWADYDNDGDLDLLIPSVYNDTLFAFQTILMRNDGPNGTGGFLFAQIDSLFAPTSHAQTAWADFDNDQDLDLFLVNISPLMDDGFIKIYKNDGSGNFTGEDILGSLSVEHGEAQWGDYDGDGDLDILIAGNVKELDSTYTHMALRIYVNDNDTFTPLDVIPCISCDGWYDLTAATWADYDSDGDMDILLAGTYNSGSQIEGRARIYTNENGTFIDSGNDLPAPRASGSRGGTFSWFDLDSDGDLDYFIAGQYFVPGGNGLVEAQMHVYRNDAEGQNNAPSVPQGLNSTVMNENSVILSWEASTDDHTPGVALTYDLELYRDNIPVTIPERLPEPGNISTSIEWSLAGLQDGNYEWTVRAVDAAYLGSAIATGSFYIGVLGSDENAGNRPIDFSLEQNYPNPFNPSTMINYQLPEASNVTLKVFDILGNEVAVLVDEYKTAGKYNVEFNGVRLSTGVYFYKLEAGNYKSVKKMILIK